MDKLKFQKELAITCRVTWVQDEITCSSPDFNGYSVDVYEWISDSILHFVMDKLFIHAGIKVEPF